MVSLLKEKELPVIVVSGNWEEMGYKVASNSKFSKNMHRLAGMFKSSYPPEKASSYYEKIKPLMPERNGKDDYNTSSYARFERCNMLVKLQKEFSKKSIIEILSDHDGQKQGTGHTICRHEDINTGTINFVYFDSDFRFRYIVGHPCDYRHDKSVLKEVKWKEILDKRIS